MIGQTKILDWVDSNIENFPHFIIIVGERGSGKTTLSKVIANRLNANFAVSGIKVDEIREVINTAYNVKDTSLYCVKDADTMRNEAKNAMLKITEEPPKNAYFIMTVEDDSTLLDTIKSRSFVFYMEPYSEPELRSYFLEAHENEDADIDFVCDMATTPYEVDKLIEYGKDFIDYVNLVIDNVALVEPANAFKSGKQLALKGEEGYDLKIFFRTFMLMCLYRLPADDITISKYIVATAPYLSKVSKLGVNKQQLYDSWVFEIRSL